MQIQSSQLSGNQQQASSSPENCRPVVTKGKEEKETEIHLSIYRIPLPPT